MLSIAAQGAVVSALEGPPDYILVGKRPSEQDQRLLCVPATTPHAAHTAQVTEQRTRAGVVEAAWHDPRVGTGALRSVHTMVRGTERHAARETAGSPASTSPRSTKASQPKIKRTAEDRDGGEKRKKLL